MPSRNFKYREYHSDYTGLPGMLSDPANKPHEEYYRQHHTGRLLTKEAQAMVQNQHLIPMPAGSFDGGVGHATMISHNAPEMMHHPYSYATSPRKTESGVVRTEKSKVSADAPLIFTANLHIPTKPTSKKLKKGYVDLMPTPRLLIEPPSPSAGDVPHPDASKLGVVPSPRRPEMYDEMENEVNMTFGGADEIEELEHAREDKAKRAWRWLLHRKDGSLSRNMLVDEELESTLLSAFYDLADHRIPDVGENVFIKEVARARGPQVLDEDGADNSWPTEVRLAFLRVCKAMHDWDKTPFKPIQHHQEMAANASVRERAAHHLRCGFTAQAAYKEHEKLVKLHAAKHSIHDAIQDAAHVHHDEIERAQREEHERHLRKRGGGGALRRRDGYRRPPPLLPRRPPSPQFEILHRAVNLDDLARLRAKHDADKHAEVHGEEHRNGGEWVEAESKYHGPTMQVLHHPLCGQEMIRLQKKHEAGLHSVTDHDHDDIGHRKKFAIDYRHMPMRHDPSDDHSHGNARVICAHCTAVVRRTHAHCHHCGHFLPLPKMLSKEDVGPGWNAEVELRRGMKTKTVKLKTVDDHHAREFALDHLKKQCAYVPGLDINNPDEAALRRAHEAFNKAYLASQHSKHINEMDFNHFKHHFEEDVGHKHRTELFPSTMSGSFSPRRPPPKAIQSFVEEQSTTVEEAIKKEQSEIREGSVVEKYVRSGTPAFRERVTFAGNEAESGGSRVRASSIASSITSPRRRRRLSYVGLTKEKAHYLWRKGVRAAVAVRKFQRHAAHAKVRKKHIPFHTGADEAHTDDNHERLERLASIGLGEHTTVPAAKLLHAAAPKRHHVVKANRDGTEWHHASSKGDHYHAHE